MSEKFEEFRADLKLRYAILKNGKRIDGGISKKELDDVSSLFDGKKSNINSQTKESIRNGVRETLKLGFTINNEKDREVFLKLCKISGYELPDLGNLGEQILKSPHQNKPYSVIIENGKVEIYISGNVLGINSQIGEVDRNGKFIYENSFFTFDSSSNNNKFDIKGDFKNINYKEAKSYTGEAYFLREDGSMFVGKLLKGFPERGAIYFENSEIANGTFSNDFKLLEGTYYFSDRISIYKGGNEFSSISLKKELRQEVSTTLDPNNKSLEEKQEEAYKSIQQQIKEQENIIIERKTLEKLHEFLNNDKSRIFDENNTISKIQQDEFAKIREQGKIESEAKKRLPNRKPGSTFIQENGGELIKTSIPSRKPNFINSSTNNSEIVKKETKKTGDINFGDIYNKALIEAQNSKKAVQIKTPNGVLFIHPDGSVKTK